MLTTKMFQKRLKRLAVLVTGYVTPSEILPF